MMHDFSSPGMLRTLFRWLLAAFFLIGGLLHFLKTAAYVSIMPPYLPVPRMLVDISGLCEMAGGLCILPLFTRRAAGWGLILLSTAVLPANVQMLLQYAQQHEFNWVTWLLVLRLPLQGVIIAWIYWVMHPNRSFSRIP